jgi:excisionase family DNA binding protein
MGPLRTIDYAATDLCLGRTRIYELIRSNALVAVKLGQGTRITDESLQDFKKSLQPLQR